MCSHVVLHADNDVPAKPSKPYLIDRAQSSDHASDCRLPGQHHKSKQTDTLQLASQVVLRGPAPRATKLP